MKSSVGSGRQTYASSPMLESEDDKLQTTEVLHQRKMFVAHISCTDAFFGLCSEIHPPPNVRRANTADFGKFLIRLPSSMPRSQFLVGQPKPDGLLAGRQVGAMTLQMMPHGLNVQMKLLSHAGQDPPDVYQQPRGLNPERRS